MDPQRSPLASHGSVCDSTLMLFILSACQSVVQYHLQFTLSEYSQHKVYCILDGHIEIR